MGSSEKRAAVSGESPDIEDADDPPKEEPSAHPEAALPVHFCKVMRANTGNIRAYIVACKCNQPDDSLGRNHKLTLIAEYSLKNDGGNDLQKANKAAKHIQRHKMSYDEARRIKSKLP